MCALGLENQNLNQGRIKVDIDIFGGHRTRLYRPLRKPQACCLTNPKRRGPKRGFNS